MCDTTHAQTKMQMPAGFVVRNKDEVVDLSLMHLSLGAVSCCIHMRRQQALEQHRRPVGNTDEAEKLTALFRKDTLSYSTLLADLRTSSQINERV